MLDIAWILVVTIAGKISGSRVANSELLQSLHYLSDDITLKIILQC